MCSCSAAIRFGTTCSGTTIFERTGARTMWSASAAWISFSESGRTSQKASVKSNGVCEMAQKFEYVRGRSAVSSGTMVKLICFRSVMAAQDYRARCLHARYLPARCLHARCLHHLIPSHHTDDDALHLDLVGRREDWLHGRVGGLQPDVPVLAV